MNKRTRRILSRLVLLTALFAVSLFSSSCDDARPNVIAPEDFTRLDREILGTQIWEALNGPESPIEMLPEEDHTDLYNHIGALYKQSYYILRSKKAWSEDRDWNLGIFHSDNETAFALPGGHLIISTGMLKALEKEYELFYLMSFENSLMDSGILFANILTFIEDSIDVNELINKENPSKALEIGTEIYESLEFNAFIVEEIDKMAMEWICESSNFRIDGISQFLPKLQEDSQWKNSRVSAINRLNVINSNFLTIDCDNSTRITSLGNDFYVTNIIPLIP